eukprot:TRINITY_DN57201_c0_g1_i1.p1 TRINITY_DN57201_c0_g1~~TRINITY_DN57201_c0_g1_i1.p1  ORF type:complete len:1374 (-),score=273.72 TRINITY_DN57201_c0_g1_i1:412-4533(-)
MSVIPSKRDDTSNQIFSWRVVHTRVIIRKESSTSAGILGYHSQGKVVDGTLLYDHGKPWLRIDYEMPVGGKCDGFMLIDGASVGLGTLLEKVETSTTSKPGPKAAAGGSNTAASKASSAPKAKASSSEQSLKPGPKAAASSAEKAPDLGDLSKWLDHPGGDIGSFEVVAKTVMVRGMPAVKARAVGVVRQGEVLQGEEREGWLLLDYQKRKSELEQGDGRWVLMHGREVGLGELLRRQLPVPEVSKTYANAIELRFPEGKDMSKYFLEVRPEIGQELSLPLRGGKSMLVHGLATGCEMQIRFVLKEGEKVVAEGPWEATETTDVETWEEADGPCTDLLGNPRGACSQCSCKCFALEENLVTLNFDLTDSRCARCGCNVSAHALWKEEEKPSPVANTASAPSKPKPAPEHHLLQKAIALPKETMLKRWRPLDFDVSTQRWPRLDGRFTEAVAWSDLHSDMGKNMEHLRTLPICRDTVLLLAGDVASSLETIESSLRLLQSKFGAIFFVPGNHELWVNKKDSLSSVHKFLAILEVCEQLGVHTRPAFISDDCAICPLFSWYKDNLVDGFSRDMSNIPFDLQTQWPWDITGRGDTHDAQQPEIADFFSMLNARRLALAPKRASLAPYDAGDVGDPTIITMSHFVPRQECYPGPRRLCGVMGCKEIDQELRSCGSCCHVFGHSHIKCDRKLEGVRYVQNPLGYPNDWHRQEEPATVWGAAGSYVAEEEPALDHRSTIAEGIYKAITRDIERCEEKMLERPPGRWSQVKEKDEIFDDFATYDPNAERELRASMGFDARKIAEQWSAPPPAREIEVRVNDLHDGEKELTVSVFNNLLVRELKERIVKTLGRGSASQIVLSTGGENALNDHVALSSLEREIEGGLVIMGIDISPSMSNDDERQHVLAETDKSGSLQETASPDTGATLKAASKEALAETPKPTTTPHASPNAHTATPQAPKSSSVKKIPKKTTPAKASQATTKTDSSTASRPAGKEIEVKVADLMDGTGEVTLVANTQMTVRQLKDQLVRELGQGNPKAIMLSTGGEHALLDDALLASLDEDTLSSGIFSVGIDLSAPVSTPQAPKLAAASKPSAIAATPKPGASKPAPSPAANNLPKAAPGMAVDNLAAAPAALKAEMPKPKAKAKPAAVGTPVEVKLVHASEDTPGSLVVSVLDTCTVLDVRIEAMRKLGEFALSKCKLVKRVQGGGFASLADTEPLKKRREFLFLGRDLPASDEQPIINRTAHGILQQSAANGTANKVSRPAEQDTTKALSARQLLVLLEDIQEAVDTPDFQRSVDRWKKQVVTDPKEKEKVKAQMGVIFASASAAAFRKAGLSVSKPTFDAVFQQIWQARKEPGVKEATQEIEGLLGVDKGSWFGIE